MRKRGTYIYRCHAGLTEAVTPLFVSDVLIGYLLFGHVFSYSDREEGIVAIKSSCSDLPINMDALKKACFERPIISYDFVLSSAHILHAVASYFVMERMVILQEDKLVVKLDAYLSAHFTEHISVSELCDKFSIGRTQLYKIANKLYGCGIASHVKSLRIELAQKLLSETNSLSIADIAERVGYHDYNYFISVFSKQVGCSPGAYRKAWAKHGDSKPQ